MNFFPAEKTGTFLAAILISLPVCGFLPVLAALCLRSKVPKPTKVTLLPSIVNVLPELSSGGVRCDSIIRITFNKPMKKSSLSLGENESIQICDYANETIHYENYFNEPVWEDNTLIIKPKHTINTLFTSNIDIKPIKVLLDKELPIIFFIL